MVSGVIPMVDRGDAATELFTGLGVPYVPLIDYRDVGIAPVSAQPPSAKGPR